MCVLSMVSIFVPALCSGFIVFYLAISMGLVSKDYFNIFRNGVAPYHYASKTCLRPRVMHFKSTFGTSLPFVLNCGRCEVCRDQKRREWVSRMLLHSLTTEGYDNPWKYCYFVTLTYGTYDLNEYTKHPFRDDWLASIPQLDAHNSTGHYCWTPSILHIVHVQKFFKRLRRLLTQDGEYQQKISYVYCGELGESYGRPHWHLIVWSDKPITKADFQFAWGYDYVKKSPGVYVSPRKGTVKTDIFHFYIGNVDFVDLGANGSLSETLYAPDGPDARHAFQYVAQYMCKQAELSDAACSRLYRAYLTLPLDKPVGDAQSYSEMENRYLKYNGKDYYHLNFEDFKKMFGSCFVSSTSYCIGKEYYLANRDRFAKGDFSLPKFRGEVIAFPHLYSTLLSFDRCPVRFEKAVVSGKTLSKTDYPVIRDYFTFLLNDPLSYAYPFHSVQDAFDPQQIAICRPVDKNGNPLFNHLVYGDEQQQLFKCDHVVFKRPEYTIRFYRNSKTNTFDGYVFSASERDYYLQETYETEDFARMVLTYIDNAKADEDKSLKYLTQQLDMFQAIQSDPSTPVQVEQFTSLRRSRSADYNSRKQKIF